MAITLKTAKECPFCGGNKIRFTHTLKKTAGGCSGVQVCAFHCVICGASGRAVRSIEYDYRNEAPNARGMLELKERALDAWNRRASEEPQDATKGLELFAQD